jgi:tetratricopeptide (TPR) repeat protein
MDARIFLEDFIYKYSVEDYKKAACNRLSYSYYLEGDLEKYQEYKEKVFTIGQSIRDRDQEAMLESSELILPHKELLKARLLSDGGYFEDAMKIMKTIDPAKLSEKAYLLEYHYRMGRIFQLKGHPEQAIPELAKAYDEGRSDPYTYATRAALNLGRIYEDKREFALATQWYQKSEEVYSSSHTTEGVKDSAEKGVKRLRGKF